MIRQLFIIFLIFISLQSKSQTPEQIGQSIFKAFQSDQKELTEYLEDSTAMKFQMIETLKEKNNDFKNIYGKDTSLFTPIQIEQLSIGLGKMFDSLYQKGMEDDWLKIIQLKHSCKLLSNKFQIIKETNKTLPTPKPNERIYLLKLGINEAAIRFYIVTVENRTYLSKFSAEGINYPNNKGEYTCSWYCENGKQTSGGCNEGADIEIKTKPN